MTGFIAALNALTYPAAIFLAALVIALAIFLKD